MFFLYHPSYSGDNLVWHAQTGRLGLADGDPLGGVTWGKEATETERVYADSPS